MMGLEKIIEIGAALFTDQGIPHHVYDAALSGAYNSVEKGISALTNRISNSLGIVVGPASYCASYIYTGIKPVVKKIGEVDERVSEKVDPVILQTLGKIEATMKPYLEKTREWHVPFWF
jgi:hypothetical protein